MITNLITEWSGRCDMFAFVIILACFVVWIIEKMNQHKPPEDI